MQRADAMRPNTIIHALFQQCGCRRCPDLIYQLISQKLEPQEFKPRFFLAVNLLSTVNGLPSDDIWKMFLYLFCLDHHYMLYYANEYTLEEEFKQIDISNLKDPSPFVQYINAAIRLERLNIAHVLGFAKDEQLPLYLSTTVGPKNQAELDTLQPTKDCVVGHLWDAYQTSQQRLALPHLNERIEDLRDRVGQLLLLFGQATTDEQKNELFAC